MESMVEYPKIQSIFKRDEGTHRFIDGAFSLPEFEYLKDNVWVYTEKVEGTNIRIGWDRKAIKIGGKTDNAQIPTFLYSKLQDMFTVEMFIDNYTTLCLYGEGYGAGIQGGGKYIPDGVSFVLFDVLIDGWWLRRKDIEDVAKVLGVDVVPIVGEGTLMDAIELIQTRTLKSNWGDFLAEGLVLKPKVELKTRGGERVITKIKHKDYKSESK